MIPYFGCASNRIVKYDGFNILLLGDNVLSLVGDIGTSDHTDRLSSLLMFLMFTTGTSNGLSSPYP